MLGIGKQYSHAKQTKHQTGYVDQPRAEPDKSVSTKIIGTVTIISRHFKIFIPVPPSSGSNTNIVYTEHPLLLHQKVL